MSDDNAKTLNDRIDALEIRVTYQDETIETLNATITTQWQQLDALARQLKAIDARLCEAEANAPASPGNERPPHY